MESTFIEDALIQSESAHVDIIMRQPLPQMTLLQGTIGPVAALQRTEVPMWLAILLRRQQRCTVLIPSWLSKDTIKGWISDERRRTDSLTPLPWHWYSIGLVLLKEARPDFAESPLELQALLAELHDLRGAKTRAGLSSLDGVYLNLTGLAHLEIASLKPILAPAMKKLSNISSTN